MPRALPAWEEAGFASVLVFLQPDIIVIAARSITEKDLVHLIRFFLKSRQVRTARFLQARMRLHVGATGDTTPFINIVRMAGCQGEGVITAAGNVVALRVSSESGLLHRKKRRSETLLRRGVCDAGRLWKWDMRFSVLCVVFVYSGEFSCWRRLPASSATTRNFSASGPEISRSERAN